MFKHKRAEKSYLEDNESLFEILKELVTEAAECFESEPKIEPLECMSRDGFIAASENCGGFEAVSFDYINQGLRYSSKEATNQIDKTLKSAQEYGLEQLGLPKNTKWDSLTEEQEEKLREHEDSYLSDETIMVQFRVMYGGVDDNGVHTAWVSAAINWEAPYHRSHISWMPGFKCETAKEVEVTWKTNKQAKERIKKALIKVGKIF